VKKNIATVAVIMFTAIRAVAASANDPADDHIWSDPRGWWDSTFYYEHDARPLFNANELRLDLFGSYLASERRFGSFPNTSIRRGLWGGGVGTSYFWTRCIGGGVDTSFQDGARNFVDHVGGNLIVRFPIEAVRLAPYIFGGGGRKFDPLDQWFADAGVGLEFRFNWNLGIFGDAQYIWNDRTMPDGRHDQALLRAGLRMAF
jgi:hypothetical protein